MATKMSSEDLDIAIISYLRVLNKKQKAAVLSVMKAFAPPYDHWKDPEFVAEMERRFEECRTGAVTTYSLEEVRAGIDKMILDRRKERGT